MDKIIKYGIVIFMISVLVGYFIGKFYPILFGKSEGNSVVIENIAGNTIELGIPRETVIETSSSDEKISPDATLILEKKYQDCKHVVTTTSEIPIEMVNLTEEKIKEMYRGWDVKEFSENEVHLYKIVDGICGEHFVITKDDDIVVVYKLDENYDKTIYQKTDISTEYLPEEDLKKLEDGIYVYGVSDLNSELENFE